MNITQTNSSVVTKNNIKLYKCMNYISIRHTHSKEEIFIIDKIEWRKQNPFSLKFEQKNPIYLIKLLSHFTCKKWLLNERQSTYANEVFFLYIFFYFIHQFIPFCLNFFFNLITIQFLIFETKSISKNYSEIFSKHLQSKYFEKSEPTNQKIV